MHPPTHTEQPDNSEAQRTNGTRPYKDIRVRISAKHTRDSNCDCCVRCGRWARPGFGRGPGGAGAARGVTVPRRLDLCLQRCQSVVGCVSRGLRVARHTQARRGRHSHPKCIPVRSWAGCGSWAGSGSWCGPGSGEGRLSGWHAGGNKLGVRRRCLRSSWRRERGRSSCMHA